MINISDIVLYIIIIISLVVLIIFFFKNEKRKKFVIKNGYYYNSIIDLNNKYLFQNYKKIYKINHYATSKRSLDNLDFNNIIIYYIDNNIDKFKENLEIIINNKSKYTKYLNEYINITKNSYEYDSKKIIGDEFKTIEEFIKYETKMLKKIKYKDNFKIIVSICANYTSPKGRNSYSRKETYNFDNILCCYEQLNNYTQYKISAQYQRSIMTDSLRYDILKRDNYRCQICGSTAKEGVKLHVDHIIPVSKGGKTTVDNLQTLCERCNLGKSNKL